MTRKKINEHDLMQATEKLILQQGYGGFNFSKLSTELKVGRSTLYEYYESKDDLIVAYMNELMGKYVAELEVIVGEKDPTSQLFQLIELMVKYAHIHQILKVIPLLKNDSIAVLTMKEKFVQDHIYIIHQIEKIINYGKKKQMIREEIPTDILVSLLFNTINKPKSLEINNKDWTKWLWEILYVGMSPKGIEDTTKRFF